MGNKMKIGIITDSTADLSQKLLDKYNIEVVPLSINFGNEIFIDGIDLTPAEFFEKIKKVEELPGTSQPSLSTFIEKYKDMKNKYNDILSIHVSSGLSGTFNTAQNAANQLSDQNIKVFDSSTISLGLGFLVLLAAKLAKKLYSIDEIIETLKKAKDNLTLYFTVDDMSYMEKGGRIGKARALLGSILNINPIISISTETGKVLPLDKTRGKKRTMKEMLDIALDRLGDADKAWLGFAHGARLNDMEEFKDKLIIKLNDSLNLSFFSTLSSRISPTLGCHVGPSVYAAFILKGDFLERIK